MRVSKSSSPTPEEDLFRGISILDKTSGRFLDVLEVVLQLSCPNSHIPEILSIFGKDCLVKFLDVFAGTTLRVPSRQALEGAMRDVVIYTTLVQTCASQRPDVVKRLAKSFGTTTDKVRESFVLTEARFKELNLTL